MDFTWDFTLPDFILLVIAVFVVLLFVVLFSFRLRRRDYEFDRKFIKERWAQVEDLLSYGKEMNYKLAVIEADKLFDYALKECHFPGQTMGDRLRMASYKYTSFREVWWAHRVRNQIVHEVRYVLKYNEAQKVLSLFRKALKELGAL